MKHVIGILGINAKMLIFLVEQMGFKTIDIIIAYGLQAIKKIAEEPGIHEGFIYSLEYWFDEWETSTSKSGGLLCILIQGTMIYPREQDNNHSEHAKRTMMTGFGPT